MCTQSHFRHPYSPYLYPHTTGQATHMTQRIILTTTIISLNPLIQSLSPYKSYRTKWHQPYNLQRNCPFHGMLGSTHTTHIYRELWSHQWVPKLKMPLTQWSVRESIKSRQSSSASHSDDLDTVSKITKGVSAQCDKIIVYLKNKNQTGTYRQEAHFPSTGSVARANSSPIIYHGPQTSTAGIRNAAEFFQWMSIPLQVEGPRTTNMHGWVSACLLSMLIQFYFDRFFIYKIQAPSKSSGRPL